MDFKNEVSKCAEMNWLSFDNLHFPLFDVNIEIWVLEATVQKYLLSSILMPITTHNVEKFLKKCSLHAQTKIAMDQR